MRITSEPLRPISFQGRKRIFNFPSNASGTADVQNGRSNCADCVVIPKLPATAKFMLGISLADTPVDNPNTPVTPKRKPANLPLKLLLILNPSDWVLFLLHTIKRICQNTPCQI